MKKFTGFILTITVFIIIIMFISCTPSNYQLTTSVTPPGGGTINPASGTFKGGNQLTLVANPNQYYKFIGWAGDVSGNTNPLSIKMNSNKNVVASFAKIQYNLQLELNTTEGGTIDPKSGVYDAGSQFKVTASPRAGFRFDHWTGAASGTTNQINILMDSDKNITANFIKQFTLKVSCNPNEGGNIDQSNSMFDQGTKVKLTASQVFPYAFIGWSGTDDDNVNPTNVTIASDKIISANFSKLSPGDWKEENGTVYRGGTASFAFQLNRYEYVECEIHPGTANTLIQDPTGNTIKDFGSIQQSNFLISALTQGRYTILMKLDGNAGAVGYPYQIKYRIYKR
jgi:hypothetical protein